MDSEIETRRPKLILRFLTVSWISKTFPSSENVEEYEDNDDDDDADDDDDDDDEYDGIYGEH